MPTMNTRERPRRSANRVEQLLLVADGAVGEEYDLAQQIRVRIARVSVKSRPHRRHHLGAAARVERGRRTPWRARYSPRSPAPLSANSTSMVLSKRITLKRSDGLQPVERVEQARLGLHDRGAAHRAGIVDDEDRFARTLLLRLFECRRRDEGKQIIVIADALAEQSDRRRGLRRRRPGQLEIAIGRHRTFGELDDLRVGRHSFRSSP